MMKSEKEEKELAKLIEEQTRELAKEDNPVKYIAYCRKGHRIYKLGVKQ